jgi:DNA modification methylase
MIIEQFKDGYVICADSTSLATIGTVNEITGEVPLIISDPPYGNIVSEVWDKTCEQDDQFAQWMTCWVNDWSTRCLVVGGAFYVWGGIGKPGFRPFFHFLTQVEHDTPCAIANLITWKKKRAIGTNHNYLFTREECAYLIKGDIKKPYVFNVPLLDEKRGYAGFNKKYPAKSEYYRRTNVWTDINELFQGKVHPTQKTQRLHEVMIEIHTNPGDYVIDPFAGSGVTAFAARARGRKFVVIERDKKYFDELIERLKVENCDKAE